MTEQRELKSLIEEGRYSPQPELVAQAMLRRHGVRALLVGGPLSPAGRIHPVSTGARRAA